mgnify:CR=1 FL=1
MIALGFGRAADSHSKPSAEDVVELISVLVLFSGCLDYFVGDSLAVLNDENAERREDERDRAVVEQRHISAGEHTHYTVDDGGGYLSREGCGVVVAGESADLGDAAYLKHERQGVDGDEHIRCAADDKSDPDKSAAQGVYAEVLGEQVCAECKDEYEQTAKYGLLPAEFLAEPACGEGGNCGGGCECGGHDGCFSGGLAEYLSGKESKEGGDCVGAAEEEEQTDEHEDKASSLGGGELLGFPCGLFGLESFLLSLSSCCFIGRLIHLALDLDPAVRLLNKEEDDEHTDYHDYCAEQENIGEGNVFVKIVRL